MKRVRANRGLVFLALLFGIISAGLVYVYLMQVDDGGTTGQVATKVPVVVAAQDIAAGTTIAPEMLRLSDLPKEALLPDVFRETEGVVGQVAAVSLVAGEQVLPSKVAVAIGPDLAAFGDNPPLNLVVPEGMRAFSIPVSQVSAAGGLIRPGDYVDVIYVVEDGLQVCAAVQDVQVLAIAQAVTVPPPSIVEGEGQVGTTAEGDLGTVKEPEPAAAHATLAVNPEQSLVVAGVMGAEGDLRLALRHQDEHGVVPGLPACQVAAVAPPEDSVMGSPAQ
jgi:pilus assembly protein CpaB